MYRRVRGVVRAFLVSHHSSQAFSRGLRLLCSSAGINDASELDGLGITATTERLWRQRSNRTLIAPEAAGRSRLSIDLPFASNKHFCGQYAGFDGEARFGKILEDLDAFAATVAHLHAEQGTSDQSLTVVTAACDRIDMRRRLYLNRDYQIRGNVTWVGRSSMEVAVQIVDKELERQGRTANEHTILESYFLLAARRGGKAAEVPPLKLLTDEDRRLFQQGEANKQRRLEESKRSLHEVQPTTEEISMIHSIFKEYVVKHKRLDPAVEVPSADTRLQSVVLCQPQARNTNNKIFGGYLMRVAYELALSNAYMFCTSDDAAIAKSGTTSHPFFLSCDDITFLRPVEIGSLIKFDSQVVYSSGKSMLIRVDTSVKDIRQPNTAPFLSNVFHFIFSCRTGDQSGEEPCGVRRVIPLTYKEKMDYIDGKRRHDAAGAMLEFCAPADEDALIIILAILFGFVSIRAAWCCWSQRLVFKLHLKIIYYCILVEATLHAIFWGLSFPDYAPCAAKNIFLFPLWWIPELVDVLEYTTFMIVWIFANDKRLENTKAAHRMQLYGLGSYFLFFAVQLVLQILIFSVRGTVGQQIGEISAYYIGLLWVVFIGLSFVAFGYYRIPLFVAWVTHRGEYIREDIHLRRRNAAIDLVVVIVLTSRLFRVADILLSSTEANPHAVLGSKEFAVYLSLLYLAKDLLPDVLLLTTYCQHTLRWMRAPIDTTVTVVPQENLPLMRKPHDTATPAAAYHSTERSDGTSPAALLEKAKSERWHIPRSELTIGQVIGRGSVGIVYAATWRGSDVALKMLYGITPQLLIQAGFIDDLCREIELMSKLRHPNIVAFYGASLHDDALGGLGIVTEYCPNGSMAELLRGGGRYGNQPPRLSWDIVMRFARDIASGMYYLHGIPIIHRDLKTLNLLVSSDWRVKITDFGLAKLLPNAPHSGHSTNGLPAIHGVGPKAAMTFVGTLAWMAPEMFRQVPYDGRVDVYSFGIVLWELLTRQYPFEGIPEHLIGAQVVQGHRPSVPAWCPAGLRMLIQECWHDDPNQRPDWGEILVRLDEARDMPPSVELPPPPSVAPNRDGTGVGIANRPHVELDDDASVVGKRTSSTYFEKIEL